MGIAIRILSIVTILALLLGNGVVAPVAAVGEVTVSINAPAEVASGDNFTATVDISQVENLDAANYDVSFNPSVLRLDNVTAGLIGDNVTPIDYWGQYPPGTPGTYRIINNFPGLPGINPPGSPPINGSGYLAKLHFKVIGSPGANSNISLSNGVLSNTLAVEIPAVWVGDSVNIPGIPDLTIYEKHEQWVVEGQSYKVYFTIKNQGSGTAPSGHDVALFVDGSLIEQKPVPVSLAPSANYTDSFATTITLTGSRDDVLVVADVNGEVAESNERNNSRSNTFVWPPAPDLTVSKSETWVVQGESYRVYYTVRNNGNAPAAAGHDVSLLVDGVTKETKAVPVTLNPGQSYSDNFTTVISLTGGVDKVTVSADINGEINESREDNNSYLNTIAWPAAPDLVISSKYERWVAGQSGNYTVNYQVRNIGNALALAGHHVELKVDGTMIEMKAVPVELSPRQSYDDTFNTVITISGGSDNITVSADMHNDIAESDETNNYRTNTWSSAAPALPDLTIYEKHEQWVVQGQSYRVYYTIKNQGSGTAPAGHAVGLTVDGVTIEQKEVPVSLAPSANYTDSFITTITLTDGWDMVRVETDVNGEVAESREDNNSYLNTFAWPPAPDLTVSKSETWVVQGDTYRVYYTITNRGNAPAAAGHDVSLLVDGVTKETKAVPVTLSSGQRYSDNFTTVISLTGGMDKVTVTADINGEVNESRENNNEYLNTFAWPAAPDLIIGMKSEEWVEGQTENYTVRFSVRNIGNAPAPAGHDVRLTVDGTAIELKQVPIELSPYQGYSDIFNTVVTISGSSDNITLLADANNEVTESDENNNYLTNIWTTPLAATTVPANNITSKSATLNGMLSSLGGYSSANVSFEWGTSSTNLAQPTTPQLRTTTGAFNANISSLSPNTTYYFRAKATADNVTVHGAVLSFITQSIPTWSVPMTAATTSDGSNSLLVFGTKTGASDGFEFGIDWDHVPPPAGAKFDAYFRIADPDHPALDEDYRAPAASIQWTLYTFSTTQSITLTWNVSAIPTELSAYMNTGISTVNMRTQSSTVLPAGTYTILISVSGEVAVEIPLKVGWNMVSLPLTPANNSVSSLFPTVGGRAYWWNPATKSYGWSTTVEPGKGYFVSSAANTTVTILGTPVLNWTASIATGWNMIGSVMGTASFTAPQDNPDGSVLPRAYWWNPATKSYGWGTTIEPGKGYFVTAGQNCTLTLTMPP